MPQSSVWTDRVACLKYGKMDKFQTLLSSTARLSAVAFQGRINYVFLNKKHTLERRYGDVWDKMAVISAVLSSTSFIQ